MNHQIIKLHPKEVELIMLIRNQYRFGTIEIETQHGLPHLVRKTIQTHLLQGVDIEIEEGL